MPRGHTYVDSINSRRPLTGNMVSMLILIRNREGLEWKWMSHNQKNATRALMFRGMLQDNAGIISVTELGLKALEQ